MTLDGIVTALLTALAVWLTLSGVAFFVVGLLPAPSAPWWRQYAFAAVALTCAYYLFRLVLVTG
jgi:hypothetical protein